MLRTGCQGKVLSKERFGSPSAIYTHFMRWMRIGFFVTLWRAGLAEYDEMVGIAYSRQSIDGALIKVPPAQQGSWSQPDRQGQKKEASATC